MFDFEARLPVLSWERSVGDVESIKKFDHSKFIGDDEKFDLTVEGNHTYVVGGGVVHNSNETVPGGNAVKFYASLRIRTQTKKKIENTKLGKFAGINMQVRNIKNRMFRPFVVADEVKLYFDDGIDPLSGLLNCLIESERVVMKGPGSYMVNPAYTPDSVSAEYKFRAAKAENRVPTQVLMDCPKLIDAASAQEVQAYLDTWGGGLLATESGEYSEKSVGFNHDGEPLDEEAELAQEVAQELSE